MLQELLKKSILLVFCFLVATFAYGQKPVKKVLQDILSEASRLLEESEASYVYGGRTVGSVEECQSCAGCLEKKSPVPKKRLLDCPECTRCGIDCSHFVHLVFHNSGLKFPYLDTSLMLSLPPRALSERYGLLTVPEYPFRAKPGDLLVYDGHVVILEKLHAPLDHLPRLRGDIIHATGGRAIRQPGQGIQRERFVELTFFRGPLRRILRHHKLEYRS